MRDYFDYVIVVYRAKRDALDEANEKLEEMESLITGLKKRQKGCTCKGACNAINCGCNRDGVQCGSACLCLADKCSRNNKEREKYAGVLQRAARASAAEERRRREDEESDSSESDSSDSESEEEAQPASASASSHRNRRG
jgi:hypothetical protein